jgi:hypothetical protein
VEDGGRERILRWPPANKQLESEKKEACCLDGPLCQDEEGEPRGRHTRRVAQVTAAWLYLAGISSYSSQHAAHNIITH